MKNKGLASWFAIWHPRYRRMLIQLMIAGALASCLAFLQDNLLDLLTRSLSIDATPAAAAHPEVAPGVLPEDSGYWGTASPIRVLVFFVIAGGVAAVVAYWKRLAAGKIAIRAKDDTEAEVLQHLLHKSDAFFSRHSPAETVNRLAVDLFRISQRRPYLMQAWGASLLVLGHLAFFFTRDWRLGIVALAACTAGALWTVLMTHPVKEMDAHFLQQDDRVKSGFEDFLRTVPEVQVGHLYRKIRRRFQELQADRSRTFLRYVRLDSALVIGNRTASLAAFVGMIAVVLYMRKTGETSAALALVPVVIWALPALFHNASDLVHLHTEFELAHTSMKRLLEYEARGTEAGEIPERQPAAPPSAEPLRVEGATYRYAGPGGKLQGGIAGVSTSFEPGQWTAVAGAAGSGKSTLMQLLLGRLEPQEGRVLFGNEPLQAASDTGLGSLLSVVPQASALLDATIGENLLFGSVDAGDGGLDPAALEVLERVGLAGICRTKALDMTPGDAGDLEEIAGLRGRVRERLRSRCGARVRPYDEGHFDRRHWVVEFLAGGRCDRSRSVAILLGKPAERRLKALLPGEMGKELVELGRRVLRNSRHLLSIPNFHVHSQLAPFPLDERVWRLRTSSLGLEDRAALSSREALALCRVALTSSPAESAGGEDAGRWSGPGAAEDFAAEASSLKELLGGACRGFDFAEFHPHLSWRENLIFGVVDIRNSRAGGLVDETVLKLVQEEGLAGRLTRTGLDFRVGRLGGNLSGGQCRLVALCRGLLRRTPVLVLDEPTSSLDPAGRAKVARFLSEWKIGRVIVTVSHDTDFIRHADRIKLMDGGKLAASGTFDELEKTSEVFRRIHRGR